MSRKCSIRTCRELSAETILARQPEPRSYKFPCDPLLKAKWDIFVNHANRTTNFRGSTQTICARHFQPSCISDTGRLLPNSVPSIADAFTLEVANKYNVTRELQTTDLNVINNFNYTILELRDTKPNTVIEPQEVDENDSPNTCNVNIGDDEHDREEKVKLEMNYPGLCQSSDIGASQDPIKDAQAGDIERNSAQSEIPDSTSPLPFCGKVKLEPSSPESHSINDDSASQNPITDTQAADNGPNSFHSEISYSTSSLPFLGLPTHHQEHPPSPSSSTSSAASSSAASSSAASSSAATSLQEPRLRRRSRFSSCSLSPSDFECPRRRRINVDRVNKKLQSLRRQVKTERQKFARFQERLRTLKSFIAKLKNNSSISNEISSLLQSRCDTIIRKDD